MRWFYYLIFFIIAGVPFSARADIFLDGFRVECIPELARFEIRAFTISDKHSVEYFEKHSKEMAQKYGIVSLWDKKALPYRSTCSYQGDTYVVEIDGIPEADDTKVYEPTRTAIINVWLNDTQLVKDLVMNYGQESYRDLEGILVDMESGCFSVYGTVRDKGQYGPGTSYYKTMFYSWPLNGLSKKSDKIPPFELPTPRQLQEREFLKEMESRRPYSTP